MSQLNKIASEYRVVKLDNTLSFTNCVYLSPTDILSQNHKDPLRVVINKFYYNVIFDKNIADGTVGLSTVQCDDLSVTVGETITFAEPVVKTTDIANVGIAIEYLVNNSIFVDPKHVIEIFQKRSQGLIISKGQHFLIDRYGVPIKIGIIGWDSDSLVQISDKTNFAVVEKENKESDDFHYFEIDDKWFEIPNSCYRSALKLMLDGFNKGIIASFRDSPFRYNNKNISSYNDFRIYAASIFLGLGDAK